MSLCFLHARESSFLVTRRASSHPSQLPQLQTGRRRSVRLSVRPSVCCTQLLGKQRRDFMPRAIPFCSSAK